MSKKHYFHQNPVSKWVISFAIMMLFIWGLGPYLAIAGKMPLAKLEIRVLVTAMLVCLYLLYYFTVLASAKFKLSAKIGTILLLLLLTVPSLLLWQLDAYHTRQLKQISIDINANNLNQLPWLDRLNILQTVAHQLNLKKYFLLTNKNLNLKEKLINQANTYYKKDIQDNLVPYLQKILTAQIIQDMNNKSPGLYLSLKTYLMLSKQVSLDKVFVKTYFQKIWQKNIPGQSQRQSLINQLNVAIEEHALFPSPNQNLIATARQVLTVIPLNEIVITVLAYSNQQPPLKFLDYKDIPGFKMGYKKLNSIYSANQLADTYAVQIPMICQTLSSDDKVLNLSIDSQNTSTLFKALVKQSQQFYFKQYYQQWLEILNNIKLVNPPNLLAVSTTLDTLKNPESELWQLLNFIDRNIAPKNVPPGFQQQVSKKFPDIRMIQPTSGNNNSLMPTIQSVSDYINQINSSANINQAAFVQAKKLILSKTNGPIYNLLTLASKTPKPLGQWLAQLSNQAEALLTTHLSNYINAQWQEEIIPSYNQYIKNRFPVNNKSKISIPLQEFSQFFGPDGTLDTFSSKYLNPFINKQQSAWTWQKINGQSLSLVPASLKQFIRAELIKHMFFTKDKKKASFDFSLTPTQLSTNAQSFNLNLEGQTVNFFPRNTARTIKLTWPGPQPGLVVSSFTNPIEKNPTLATTGPWAWFKMLQQSILNPTQDPKKYQLIFTIGDNYAKFELNANQLVNPFIPGVLSSFRCPTHL